MKDPKKKIEIIFYLIKRMSPTEKRYFKLNNKMYKGGDKDFVRLFDFINKMEVYDMSKIENFFTKNKVNSKNLCVAYLHNKLIECIDDEMIYLPDGQNIIMPHMKAVRAYIKMELIDLAYKELLKLEELAELYELYNYLRDIYDNQENLISLSHMRTSHMEHRKELYAKHKRLYEINKVMSDIGYANYMFMYDTPDSDEFKCAIDIMSQYDINNFPPLVNILHRHAYFWYNRNVGQQELAYISCKTSIKIFDENPHLIEAYIERYLTEWSNLFVSITKTDKRDIAARHYEQYQQLPQRFKNIFVKFPDVFTVFYKLTGHLYEAAYNVEYEQYESMEKLSKNTLKTLEKYPTSISRATTVTSLFLRICYGFVLLQDKKSSQFWMDKLESLPYISEMWAYLDMTVLKLILFYEQEDFSLFESNIRSIKRKSKKEDYPDRIIFMLDFLSSLTLKRNQHKLTQIWKTGHQKMLEIERKHYCYIPYSKWIAQKI